MSDLPVILVLLALICTSTLSVVYLMTREGLKTSRGSTVAVVTIVIPVASFLLLWIITGLVTVPVTYKSSMGQMHPVRGTMRVECHGGNPKKDRDLDVRAIGIAFDDGKKTRILVELNDVPPDQYSPTDYWLRDAGLCQVYVRDSR